MGGKTATKAVYFDKLKGLLEEYKSIFIVTVDNVSSQQMHKIRKSLRDGEEASGVVLMGKNTMVLENLSGQQAYTDSFYRFVEPLRVSSPTFQNTNACCLTSRAMLASFSPMMT